MNPLKSIRNLFKRKSRELTEEDHKFNEAFDAFLKGKELYSERKFQDAMDYFDRAIQSGVDDSYSEIYELRAISLQSLNFDLEAIDDFNKAISLKPEEANLYFMRGLSRGVIGDFTGRVSDYKEAVRLSEIENKYNEFWNNYAKETGWKSATSLYETYLIAAQVDVEFYAKSPDIWQRRLERHPLKRRKES